jgi:TolB protein
MVGDMKVDIYRFGMKLVFLGLIGCTSILAQESSTIVLGPIEGELAKKQIALDLEGTQKDLLPLAKRAINAHGAFRLASSQSSKFGITLFSQGTTLCQVRISSGKPRRIIKTFSREGNSVKQATLRALDQLVFELTGVLGFFDGQLAYLSSLTGNKEIFVSDALMSTARPQTSFGKITFNTSWDNSGKGVFFTSNRKIFNNVYHLDLASRKISNVASYKGSNLRAVQNPRTNQVALILSASGNPELWLAENMGSKPRKVTNNRSNESGPCWSPDGRRMIVTSDSRGRPQLYEVSLSTGRLSRIPTNISSHCAEASWNPVEPTRIAFTAALGGGFQVCEYSFADRKSKVLTQGSQHGMQPTWARDGRHLYYTERASNGATRIMLLDTEFDEAKPIPLHDSSFGPCSQASFFFSR